MGKIIPFRTTRNARRRTSKRLGVDTPYRGSLKGPVASSFFDKIFQGRPKSSWTIYSSEPEPVKTGPLSRFLSKVRSTLWSTPSFEQKKIMRQAEIPDDDLAS